MKDRAAMGFMKNIKERETIDIPEIFFLDVDETI